MTTQLISNRNKLLTESHRFESGKPIYRAVSTTLRSLDEAARTIEFTSSTEGSDRMGDVIRVAGWDLANFEKNPVFLFSHRSEDPPIGRILGSKKELGKNAALVQTAQFATKDIYPFADTIFKLYKAGFMNAVSVGFMPKSYQPIISPDDEGGKFLGYEFLEQELFELSAVPVPANPEALGRILRGATEGEKFDGVKLGELFLRDAVERNVIASDEAERMHKFICGDKNPPWAYSLSGVTFSEEPVVSENKANEFGEWKEASSQCVKRAERVVERVERAMNALENTAVKLAGLDLSNLSVNIETIVRANAVTAEQIELAVRKVLAEQANPFLQAAAKIEAALRGEISDAAPAGEVKSLADAHDLMKSAHKDMANAHRKTAQAIGHISAAMEDPAEPDADDKPGAKPDPNDPPEPDADDSTVEVVDPLGGKDSGRTSASANADIFEVLDIKPEPDIFATLGIIQPDGDKAASESVGGEVPPSNQTSRSSGAVPQEPTDPVEALIKALDEN